MSLSFSQLSLYRTCPKQFEFANVKKIPRGVSSGESFGSSVHNTLKKFGELEIGVNSKQSTVNSQLALFSASDEANCQLPTANCLLDYWHQSFIVEGYESKADADAARNTGEKMMQHFFDWWSTEERDVIAVEKGFAIEVDVNTIKGRFDRVERSPSGIRIIDFKTGSARSQSEVDSDLQLSIYALASETSFGEPCADLTLLFLHEDGIKEVRTTRSKDQLEEASRIISALAEQIDEEEFTATPSEKACKYCPYRGICPDSAV